MKKRRGRDGGGRQSAATQNEDRLPPWDEGAERGVLSCVLQDPEKLGLCLERIGTRQNFFYDQRHGAVFGVLRSMYDAQMPINLITVQSKLADAALLEQVGGLTWLSELQDAAPSAEQVSVYLDQVRQKFLLRSAVKVMREATERILDPQNETPAEELLVQAEGALSALTEAESKASERPMREVINAVITDMEQWHYTRGKQQLRGLPTGPGGNYLDKVLTGIRADQFVTVAARPGDGKSSLALNVVEYLAEHYVWYEATGKKVVIDGVEVDEMKERKGMPVAVFSIEMDNESLAYRLIFGRAGVSEAQYNQGFASKDDATRLTQAAHDLSRLNIYLDDTPAQSIGQIAAKARRMAKQYGIKLFVLDYLQLAESDDPRDEVRVRVNKISKKIMALKKQLKVPWLVLAQLNRNIETAERDRPPVLSDLAESGAIEQDSDKVIIIKKTPRRDLEQPKAVEGGEISDKELLDRVASENNWDWSRRPRRVDLWVVKNRRGPTGKAEYVFQGNLCRFEDWHLFKVKWGLEARKEGESKHLETPVTPQPAQTDFGAVARGEGN